LSVARSLPVIDTLLAATAIRHGITLVTRNTGGFESTGTALIDPWQIR
jgi:predicted nucleic acid-binding protein